nr:hypothetical protein GCM10020063_019680 [Dactylosporangium thailandense]
MTPVPPPTRVAIDHDDYHAEFVGLLLREDTECTEDGGDPWWVELEPGNYMAFSSPWDSGEYDT